MLYMYINVSILLKGGTHIYFPDGGYDCMDIDTEKIGIIVVGFEVLSILKPSCIFVCS